MPHQIAAQRYILKQDVSLIEAVTQTMGAGCCEVKNVYHLYDDKGSRIYQVSEESNCCCRICCNPLHEFNLKVHDHGTKEQVMTFYHPFKAPPCCPVCMDCCMSEIVAYDGAVDVRTGACFGKACGGVEDPQQARMAAVPIGYTQQPQYGGGFNPTVQLWGDFEKNAEGFVKGKGAPSRTIVGPTCCIGGLLGECLTDISFNVHEGANKEGKREGKIAKQKPDGIEGAAKELFTDSDNFMIDMPAGASPGVMTGLLASTVLIDYMFFEQQNFECNPLPPAYMRCVLCNFYCFGCIYPCVLRCEQQQEGS